MKDCKVLFQDASTLLQQVGIYRQAIDVAVSKGEIIKPLIIDMMGPVFNPHEILGAYDVLTMSNDLDIRLRILSNTSTYTLAIAAALPEGKAYVAKNTFCHSLAASMQSMGSATEATILKESVDALRERIVAAITSTFDFTKEEIEEGIRDKTFFMGDVLVAKGLMAL